MALKEPPIILFYSGCLEMFNMPANILYGFSHRAPPLHHSSYIISTFALVYLMAKGMCLVNNVYCAMMYVTVEFSDKYHKSFLFVNRFVFRLELFHSPFSFSHNLFKCYEKISSSLIILEPPINNRNSWFWKLALISCYVKLAFIFTRFTKITVVFTIAAIFSRIRWTKTTKFTNRNIFFGHFLPYV